MYTHFIRGSINMGQKWHKKNKFCKAVDFCQTCNEWSFVLYVYYQWGYTCIISGELQVLIHIFLVVNKRYTLLVQSCTTRCVSADSGFPNMLHFIAAWLISSVLFNNVYIKSVVVDVVIQCNSFFFVARPRTRCHCVFLFVPFPLISYIVFSPHELLFCKIHHVPFGDPSSSLLPCSSFKIDLKTK